jgi:DNA-binding transcriptional LysR family regulator
MPAVDEFRDLALFVAVAEARSFTRAAAKLSIPTSSLSRRIAELESSLGIRLFHRTTRRVELTEAGTLYLERCQRIIEAAQDARAQLRGLADTPQGLLRVSAEAEVGPRLVAPLVAEFLAQYPGVTLDLDLSPRRVDLLAEGYDVAVRLGRLPDSALTVRRLALLRVSLYAAPDYLARHGAPTHPDDLVRHARIHLMHQGDSGDWPLTRDGETVEVRAGGLVSANNMTMVRHLARLGVGIAVLDEVMAGEDVSQGTLRPVLEGWTLPPVALSVLTPSRLLPAKTRRFVEMLARRTAGLVSIGP